jgi:hypothetical protein
VENDSNRDDYDLGREIEKSWLIRGEYDKVFEARGAAYRIYGGIVLVSVIVCGLFAALGSDLDADAILLIVGAVFLIGLVGIVWCLSKSR